MCKLRVCVRVYMCIHTMACVKMSEQLVGVSSLLLLCGFPGLGMSHQSWQKTCTCFMFSLAGPGFNLAVENLACCLGCSALAPALWIERFENQERVTLEPSASSFLLSSQTFSLLKEAIEGFSLYLRCGRRWADSECSWPSSSRICFPVCKHDVGW